MIVAMLHKMGGKITIDYTDLQAASMFEYSYLRNADNGLDLRIERTDPEGDNNESG
jgi:hypothetical protein